MGLDRPLRYATCKDDGREIGQLIIMAHYEWNCHASRIHHHRTRRDSRPPPGLRGKRPGHGSRPRRPGVVGAKQPDRPGDLPEAPRDDPAFAAHRPRSLIVISAGVGLLVVKDSRPEI